MLIAHAAGRTPVRMDVRETGGLVVHLARDARTWVRQDGRTARLDPGDFALVDGRRPFEVGAVDDHVTLALPIGRVSWLPALPPCAVRVDGSLGAGAVASSVIRTLAGGDVTVEPAIEASLSEIVVGMISLAARDSAAAAVAPVPRAPRDRLVESVLAEIERSLPDPGLSRDIVAARLAISPSYLSKLLAAEGTSFGRALLEARLCRCHAELRSPLAARRQVGEIATAAGLLDASYFARVYKKRYGVTPSQTRDGEQEAGRRTDLRREP